MHLKVKVLPITGHEGPEGEQRYSPSLSLPRHLDWGGWSAPRTGRFTPRERPGTHCTAGWVRLRAGLDGCGKSRPPPPGFDPRIVQTVASRYTDCAMNLEEVKRKGDEWINLGQNKYRLRASMNIEMNLSRN